MRRIVAIIISLILLVRCQPEKEKDQIISNGYPNKCDEYFTALTQLNQFNGSLLIHKDNKLVLRKAYNIKQDSIKSLKITINTQFDLRSISKLFAKASIIQLEQEGKLKRRDPIQKFIPGFPQGEKITIEHLMHNSSGLPREFSVNNKPELELTKDEIIELAKNEKLEFDPGLKQRYSNVGFQLLYIIISEVSNLSYSEYLRETFFIPLGMEKSGGHFNSDKSNLKNYGFGHYLNDQKKLKAIKTYQSDEFKIANLYSSVDDLKLFIDHISKPPFSEELHKNKAIGHAGGTEGKRAYVYKNLEKNYSIIFLSNFENIPFQQITEDLKNILEDKPYEIPKKIERKAIQLAINELVKFEGIYDFEEAGHIQLEFKLEGNQLIVYQNGENSGPIYPENKNTFFWEFDSKESIQFIKVNKAEHKVIMDFKGAKWEGKLIKGMN